MPVLILIHRPLLYWQGNSISWNSSPSRTASTRSQRVGIPSKEAMKRLTTNLVRDAADFTVIHRNSWRSSLWPRSHNPLQSRCDEDKRRQLPQKRTPSRVGTRGCSEFVASNVRLLGRAAGCRGWGAARPGLTVCELMRASHIFNTGPRLSAPGTCNMASKKISSSPVSASFRPPGASSASCWLRPGRNL